MITKGFPVSLRITCHVAFSSHCVSKVFKQNVYYLSCRATCLISVAVC